MDSKIQEALARRFEKHRIVLWYDRRRELRAEFEALHLPDVEKIELKNNEFGVKYRILREQPNQKFLLYHEGPQPDDLENWLLDVLLAYGEFQADQASIWLSQLELGPEYAPVVTEHEEFYRSGKRLEALRRRISSDDSQEMIRLKMLAVCVNSEARPDEILEGLLAELAQERDDAETLIERCNLTEYLWKRARLDYGYESMTPGVKDFAITLFKSSYGQAVGSESRLRPSAQVFFKRWKDGRQNSAAFRTLSERFATLFRIETDLQERELRTLVGLDHYRLIDQKIISDLVQGVAGRTISAQECREIIATRRSTYWYSEFERLYLAIGYAAQFIAELEGLNLTMHSLLDGVQRYSRSWYRIDQLYRQFNLHVRISSQHTLMRPLSERIENLYSNHYLLKLNNDWQALVDQAESWRIPGITRQAEFFSTYVEPVLSKPNKKIYVIISDALRYEVADELATLIRQQDRYDAELEPMLAVLPSYTQLGMAALLPHRALSIRAESGASVVFVDEKDSRGIQNRSAILARGTESRGIALQAEQFMQMTVDEARDLARNHDVLYLFHNRIDAMGDKRDSEERVFEAVNDTFDELLKLIKKLANANANNILVTADHGFIYQNRELDESDYLSVAPEGQQIIDADRRFVIGQGLVSQNGLKSFTSAQVGLSGDVEIQIPKSINRLRKKGSGSRYVHGGATLQEIVVPVIRIAKKRISDVRRVEVAIVRGVGQVITAGQLTVKLYQKEPVTEKVQPRTLRIGLYTREGKLISDSHDITFDLREESERDRERPVRLILSKEADAANGQHVYVRLLEREDGTSHDVEYESAEYVLRRSFTSDFDF